jgi:multiple sugar transport system permease protein
MIPYAIGQRARPSWAERFPKAYLRAGRIGWTAVRAVGLLATIVFIFLPVVWLALTAFKYARDAYSTRLFFTPTLENFQAIFAPPNSFGPLTLNSVLVSTATVAIAIPVAAMAAYAFSRFQFRGKNVLLVSVLSVQFIPPVVIALHFFTVFRTLGLLDSRIGLVILNLSFVTPFAIWMIKGFIDSLPGEIEEAAFVDGCNRLQLLRYVSVPLIMPGIITSAVFSFIQSWNEFLFALILTRRNAVTLTVGLMGLNAERGIIWEQMAAAGLIVMVPIFVLSLTIRRHFVQGITMGAVK